ncbi:hypothetical protein PAECIP111893_01457 [Paenibacillus plantiphilus]|uniref:HAMP domain-containing protein n=1 Tax=Paenibacillus plantiphilus TaxID=2905650 RepID=A0ABM9SFJ2_9BACL|nr:histidine kinase [Paenibacillus plantiphilus]CAH1200569.1 hypothetical protein PAECIP111893_01457 [Paenibacillus plantiphilus]
MGLRRAYQNYISNNFFVKLILIFSIITVLTIVTLSYFTFQTMSESMIQNELNKQRDAMESVNRYVNNKYESVQLMLQDVYRNPKLSENVTYLLKYSFQEYVMHRLDQFSSSSSTLTGLDYFKNLIADDPDIANIIFYSSEKQFLYVNSQQGLTKLIYTNASRSFVPDAMALQNPGVSLPNYWVRQSINQWEPKLYSVQSTINDMGTLKSVGQLIVYFNSERIKSVISGNVGNYHGYILVLASDGKVVFDSSDQYYGSIYPYADKLNTLTGSGVLQEDSYITTLASPGNSGYLVVGIAPKSEVAKTYKSLQRLIILISTACILVAVIIPSLFVINFAKRTNKIIRSMRKVETGDMTVRIQDTKGDELGQISRGFNEMLGELTRYIERVYKAEIKQKHTEMTAMQARINPHFLYNTLEVIRMRAISQGITDVSEMIYSLAMLFKSFVQQQTVVTLREEMENCSRYLELFRIRYKDKFSYSLHYDRELAERKMIKMSLQPLVENYIVHGMRTDGTDNEITVCAVGEADVIRVTIQDNGIGIPQGRLEEIKRSLDLPETEEEESSLGLRSVNERLKLMYGKEYGVEITSQPAIGTTVTLWFPYSEGSGGDNV